jgi:hypothetical protein
MCEARSASACADRATAGRSRTSLAHAERHFSDTFEEIVRLMESDKDVRRFFREKVRAAVTERRPLHRPVGCLRAAPFVRKTIPRLVAPTP